MKKQFSLLTLLLLFTIGIGQMWAADPIENVGTYSTQVISADGLTSTWTFPLPSSQINVPAEETEENDVIYAPSAGGKMKFTSSNQFSWNSTSSGYFYVPSGAAGTITMTVKNSSDTRWLQLYVDGSAAADSKRLWSKYAATASDGKKGPQSFSFTSDDLTTKGTKTYLHFKDNNKEMKIASISITLTTGNYRNDLTAHTVTYKSGYDEDLWITDTDAKTVAGCPTQFSYTGYDFAGWKDADNNAVEVGANVTEDMTLTAQWTVHVDKYTVKYMDGTTVLGTEEVNVNSTPVGLAENPKKDCYTFSAWDPALNTISGEKNQVIEVSATWTPRYASSFNFGTTTDLTKDNIASKLDAKNIACSVGDKGSYDSGATTGYLGYKFKNNGDYVAFLVQEGYEAIVTYGYTESGWKVNGTDAGVATATQAYVDKKYQAPVGGGAKLFKLVNQSADKKTSTLSNIVIQEIPLLDNDATLKNLKVGGANVAGFSANTYTYYYEVPYGTAVENFPQITAEANSTKAKQVAIQQAVWTGEPYNCYRAQANVQAEDESWGYYDVRFYFGPKYGVELIKATHTGEHTATKAGYWKDDVTIDKTTQDGGKIGSNDHFFGLTLGNEKTFKAGDMVVIKASNISSTVELFNTKTFTSKADSLNYINKGNFDSHSKMYIYTLEADADKLYLYRTKTAGSSMNPTVDYIAVYRQMPAFIESFEIAGVEDFVIDQDLKTITADVANTFDVTALTPTVKYWGNGGGAIDKTGAKDFTNPVQYTVSSAYSEDATGDYAPVTYTVTITKVVPSVTPSITTQPQGANYYEGASIAALTVVAESAEGELSYQWQVKNGLNYEDIEGATAASYTPAISAIGSYVYRVVVTNTEESKPATSLESDDATIVISADPACATFAEASIPTAEPYQYTNTGEWTIYNASSSGKRNGGDQIFGNVKDFDGNTVKGFAKERCVLIFEKDMKQIRFYSANAQRSWGDTPVRVSDDVETFLGTGTPSYSEYAATTSIIQADPSNNKEQIFIADGEFLAGKCYWFAFSSSLQIFQICAVEADPLADAPVFNADLANEAVCPGASFTTLDATAAPVTSYKWYKDGEVIENAEAATYTPTEAGTYYCIATNSAEGHRDNSLKSAEAVLSVNEVTAITAHVDAVGTVDAEKTISVTAEGTNLTYQWQACDANGDVTDATVLGTAASLNVVIAAETKYYLATVTGACGVETQVVEAREWHEVEPVNVTGSRVWNWTSAAFNGIDEAIAFGNTSVEELMANVSSKVPNYESFRSDMLYGTGQYVWRPSDKYFQGFKVRFVTTVPGIVKVTYRGTGNNKNIILSINDSTYAEYQGGFTTVKNFVQAGEVVIEGVGGTGNAGGMTRIQRIEFVAEDDYHRPVNPSFLGTLCWTNNAVLFGATLYEFVGKDENNYLAFDEVANNYIKAGKPYIFMPKNGNTEIKVYNIDDEAALTEDQAPVNHMYGTITGKTLVPGEDDNMYYFSANHIWAVKDFTVNIDVPAYYCYIDYPAVLAAAPANAPANGRRRVTMGVKGEQVATGFENLNASEKPMKLMINGQIYILRGEKMYDVTGKVVK